MTHPQKGTLVVLVVVAASEGTYGFCYQGIVSPQEGHLVDTPPGLHFTGKTP